MKTLNASDLWVNLLAALPSLVGVLQIPGGIMGRGVRSYKRFVAPGGLSWRLFYLPFMFLPLLAVGPQVKLSLLTLCVTVASICTVFVGPVYNDWIAELVPESSRGFYFARRNAIAAIVGALVGILGAVLLDAFRSYKLELPGFTTVYVLSIVCAFISWYFFTRMADLERPNPIKQTLKQGLSGIKAPFADPLFRPVLLFLAASTVGQTFAGNLFVAFARESLNLDYKIIQGTAVMMALGNVAAAASWGFLADKYGNKPLLFISGALLSFNPIPWVLCMPGQQTFDSVLLLTAHFFMGLTWCCINLCSFNIMLVTAKPDDRANYIGAATTVTALAGGIAPLVGAAMMELLRGHMSVPSAYKYVFASTGILRLVSVLCLFRVNEQGAVAIRDTLRDLSTVSIGGVRAMRTLSRSPDVASRESAIEQAGSVRASFAADEIIKALHDPTPQIRRQAAMALSRLDDPRAVHELLHQLEDHPDLLDEEIVAALGAVGTLEALPALVKTLDLPRPLLRRAAARALGSIGSRLQPSEQPAFEAAASRLIAIAEDPSDPDLRRASLQALRHLGSSAGAEAIASAAMDKSPSVRIAAAEAIEELGLRNASECLRQSLATFSDEAGAEVAYALGVVGDRSDIPLILDEAARSVSMITRRRCLLGVARAMGVEKPAYRLMLVDGMARDAALQELLRPLFRRHPAVREALGQSGSDEPGAIRTLASAFPLPEFQYFIERPVEELFLVAAVAVAPA